MIGKSVQGFDDENNDVKGMVNSVRVQQDNVYLELDNGKSLALGRVTNIAAATTAAATAATTPVARAA